MLGQGKSSLSIWTAFQSVTTATFRQLTCVVKISWNKIIGQNAFGLVGTAILNTSIIQGQLSTVTPTESFDYFDESENVMTLSYDRQLVEPLSGISYAMGDVKLDNTNSRFTPSINSTIGTALIPYRPIQIFVGFKSVKGQDKVLPVLKGLTLQPRSDKITKTTTIQVVDYIDWLSDKRIEKAVYIDQRTDQIIEDILTTAGFGSSQFSLDVGLNTIGYAFFEEGATAGKRIQQLAESEEGHFFQDEEGILRFHNRRRYNVSPQNTVQMTLRKPNIIFFERDNSREIINKVIVKAKPRQVSATQLLWTHSIVEDIDPSSSIEIWATFDDPVTEITTPVATTDYTANTQSDGGGSDLTSDIDVTVYLFANSAKITVTNNSLSTAYLTLLKLRGKEATIIQTIQQVYSDAVSIAKYEEREKIIENDFIDDSDFAYYLCRAIVLKYRNPEARYIMGVRGLPQLQLKDKIAVEHPQTGAIENYRIMRVQGQLNPGSFTQKLYLRKVSAAESDSWAIVGSSTIEGADTVGS